MDAPLSVFFSYAYESAEHLAWVTALANHLDGDPDFHVVFDQYDARPGDDLTVFMDRLPSCDRAIVIVTPQYVAKATAREGGVGYESSIISSELFRDQLSGKFIPILRKGDDVPAFLKSKIRVDFRDDAQFARSLAALKRGLQGLAPVERPPKARHGDRRPQVSAPQLISAPTATPGDAPIIVASLTDEQTVTEYFKPVRVQNIGNLDAFNIDIADISNGVELTRFSRITRLSPNEVADAAPRIEGADVLRNGLPDLYRFAQRGIFGKIFDSVVDGSRAKVRSPEAKAALHKFVAPFKIVYNDAFGRTWSTYSELTLGRDRSGQPRFSIEYRRLELS